MKRVRGRFVVAAMAVAAIVSGVVGAGAGAAVAVSVVTIDPTSLAPATVGTVYPATTLTASGGVAPYSFALSSGSLPNGLTLSSAGLLSGTPTAFPGNYSLTITATDDLGFTSSQPYTLSLMAPTIAISPTTLTSGQIGQAYSQTLTASGTDLPLSWSIAAGALPGGLTLSAGGTLSGTPTQAGSYPFTVSTSDAYGDSAARPYTLQVLSPALTLVPSTLTGMSVGVPYDATIVAGGGTAPWTYFMYGGTALPGGLSLAADGRISGTPAVSGPFSFTIAATDSSTGTGAPFTVARAYNVTVGLASAPTLASVSPGHGTVGQAVRLTGTTFFGDVSVDLDGTPVTDLTVVSTTAIDAVIPPIAPGVHSFTVTTPAGTTSAVSFAVLPALTLTGAILPHATAGVAYSTAIAATGGLAPYTYAVAAGSTLPAGLTLTAGTLTGTPTAVGAAAFDLTVTDTDGATATATFTLQTYSSTVEAPASATAGGSVELSGTDFQPGEYAIVLHSDPVSLGTVTVAADGILDATLTIPAATPAGAHTLVLSLDGEVVASVPLTVQAAAVPATPVPTATATPAATAPAGTGGGAAALASTGSDASPLWLGGAVALALLLAGSAGLGLAARSRRRAG